MDRLQALTRDDCIMRLAGGRLGRVVFTERALPAIRPVNYAMSGSHVVLRTAADGLGRRLDGQVVAFEVDDIDDDSGTGWSVVVTGTARLVRVPGELSRLSAVGPITLAGEGHDGTVVITPGDISGRRIAAPVDA